MTIKWVIGILHYQKRLTEKTICMRVCASLYRGRTDVTDNFVINKVSHDQSYNLILSIFSVCTCSPYTPNWFFLEMVCWFLFLLYQLFIQERTTSHKKKEKKKEKKEPLCTQHNLSVNYLAERECFSWLLMNTVVYRLSPLYALSSYYGGIVIGYNGSPTIDPKTKDTLSDCNPFYSVINQDIFFMKEPMPQWVPYIIAVVF